MKAKVFELDLFLFAYLVAMIGKEKMKDIETFLGICPMVMLINTWLPLVWTCVCNQ